MRQSNIFKGAGVALITPFLSDYSIDFDSFERLLRDQLDSKTDFICLLGTTAETPCLTLNEKRELIRRTVQIVNHQKPILLGCGGNNTTEIVKFITHENLEGISGLLVVTPYYNKPRQEGLYQHYKLIAESTQLPIVLYNVPGRTGVNLEPATIMRLTHEFSHIVAVKEASGNLEQIKNIIDTAVDGFELLGGDDGLAYDILKLGAQGVISVIGNAYPNEFADLVHGVMSKEYEKAQQVHLTISPLYRLIMVDGNPSGIKSILSVHGRIQNHLRLPLVPVSPATQAEIINFVSSWK